MPRPLPSTGVTVAISCEQLVKTFGPTHALDGLDLEVDIGEVHGFLGPNGAGKTVTMRIVLGLLRQDSGTVRLFDGDPWGDAVRLHRRLAYVPGDTNLWPELTGGEVIDLLGQLRGGLDRARRDALVDRFDLDPTKKARSYSKGNRQKVALVAALASDAELLVLDEPTAVLTPQEWHELARTLRDLADDGKAVIFISHKLDEQLQASDWCTVLRDGGVVGTVHTDDVDKAQLARMMVGRDVVLRVEREHYPPGEPVIEVSSLRFENKDGRTVLDDVSFAIREREILGVAGIDGNGQRELVEVLTGVHRPSDGTIRVRGREEPRLTPQRFHRHGGAVIPEDRHRNAVALDLSISDNLMLKDFRRAPFSRRGVTASSPTREHCEHLVAEYDVRTPSVSVIMRQLSGGNQQRAVVARELCGEPTLLIVSQPTRGLDVGAMEFVYDRLLEHRKRGGAILLVSTELDEILSLSDRIAVIVGGRFVRILDPEDADDETLGLLMGGVETARG